VITNNTCYDPSQSIGVQIGRAILFVLILTETALEVEGGTRTSNLVSLGLEGEFPGDGIGAARFRETFERHFSQAVTSITVSWAVIWVLN
jgi:hypothetical protein